MYDSTYSLQEGSISTSSWTDFFLPKAPSRLPNADLSSHFHCCFWSRLILFSSPTPALQEQLQVKPGGHSHRIPTNEERIHTNEESIITSNAHHNEQTGRLHHLCWITPWAAGQHWSASGKDWILITGTSVRLGLSELPQRRTDSSIIIFRHLSFLDTSQRKRGVLNFPTRGTAETGTGKVF